MKKNDPFTREDQTRFTMRIDTELLEQIKAEAEKNKRSAAKEIEYILEQYIKRLSERKPLFQRKKAILPPRQRQRRKR